MSEKELKSLKAAVKRAVWTVSQTAVGVIGTAAYMGQVDWKAVASAAMLAGILSLLKSFAVGMPECETEKEEG